MEARVQIWIDAIRNNRIPDPPDINYIELKDLHEIRKIVDGSEFEDGEAFRRRIYSGQGRRYNSSDGGFHTFRSIKPMENGKHLEIGLAYRRLNGGVSCKEVDPK